VQRHVLDALREGQDDDVLVIRLVMLELRPLKREKLVPGS